jgi:hypothetical protein
LSLRGGIDILKTVWAGRIISTLAVLFLVFDAVGHILKPAPVIDATARLGFPLNLSPTTGIVELVCIAVYVFPRTAALGAILLTGYLGGATAIQVRAGSPMFEEIFPIIFGVLIWVGICLRDDRLRASVLSHS